MCRNNFRALSPPGSYLCTDTHCFQWTPWVNDYAPGNSHLQDQAVVKQYADENLKGSCNT